MPLTPRFSLRQTPTHVFVEISVPSFRLSAGEDGGMEVLLMGDNNSEFHFYAKPYLLKLNFFPNGFMDQETAEDGKESGVGTAKYDPSEQLVVVPLKKKKRVCDSDDDNNHWPDLDLTARMVEAREIPKKWLHAVVDESSENDEHQETEDETNQLHETEALETGGNPLLVHESGDGYGFDGMFRNIFTDYCRSGLAEEMLELYKRGIDPENSSIDERRDGRLEHEAESFDFDRYLADLELPESDDYLYPMVQDYQPWWRQQQHDDSSSTLSACIENSMEKLTIGDTTPERTVPTSSIFTEDEKLLLSTIPYPLLPKQTLTATHARTDKLWCGVFELVLAYVYDHLTTMGDPTVESSWTISILSSGMSWLDSSPSQSIQKTLRSFLRRVLVYPYWRNADHFGNRVVQESFFLLKHHRVKGITKALLQIRSIVDKSEAHYLGNKLLVDPYLFWIQNLREDKEKGSSLDRIIEAIESFANDDGGSSSAFGSLVTQVEKSLEIDVLMSDYFGQDEGSQANCSSDESSSDSEESSSSDEDEDEDESIQCNENENHLDPPKSATKLDECVTTDGTASTNATGNTNSPPSARAIQLLDDEVGCSDIKSGQPPSPASLLYCIGDTTNSSADRLSPNTSGSRQLITEVPSENDEKRRLLIEEL